MLRIQRLLIPASLLVALPWTGCDSNATNQRDAPSEPSGTNWTDTIDLRRAYQQYYEAREDWPPAWPYEEAGKLHPVDEAPRDTLFFVFRERLREAVARKDAFALLDMLDEEVKVDFGGGQGVADFVRAWSLDSEQNIARSQLWPVLDRLLAMGGTFSENGQAFTAPYVFSRWPDDLDAFQHVAITGEGVRLRERPELNSRIRQSLSYELVELLERSSDSTSISGDTFPWIKVRTARADSGYVWGKYVYAPIGYRMGFYKTGETDWAISFLLAGD